MKPTNDAWHVRLPDGRVLRAKSTNSVRHHIDKGRIPPGSQVRRGHGDTWTPLDRAAEFAPVAPGRPVAPSPPAPEAEAEAELQTVGVRGVGDELLAALDNTLDREKLLAAATAGVALSLGTLAVGQAAAALDPAVAGSYALDLVRILVGLTILAAATTVITRVAYLEVSLMRPVQWAEASAGAGALFVRVLVAGLLVAGAALAALAALRRAPGWIAQAGLEQGWSADAVGAAQAAAAVVALLGGFALWVVVGLSWLLAPILAVEECSPVAALRQWCQLVRDHLSRLFLYEGLAVALGLVATLPFVIPVWLSHGFDEPGTSRAVEAVKALLQGVAATPLLAYLAVANVFIYLNLRYEYSVRG